MLTKKMTKKQQTLNITDDSDVKNKGFVVKKLSKKEGQIYYIEKDYTEFELHNKEDLLIERAVETTKQILYDKRLFANYGKTDQVLKDYSIVEVNY